MIRTNDLHIVSSYPLPSPEELRKEFPLPQELAKLVMDSRAEIGEILNGKSPKFLAVVGPCSIHNTDAALGYAEKLSTLARELSDRLLVVMRCYLEKPRTTLGWKGLVYDPDLNGTGDICKGVRLARKVLLDVLKTGLPIAVEMLDPLLAQYTADCVSWAAIGARTTEAQTHRQLGSGLSMPVGFKNATDGSLQTAIDAVITARSGHYFLGLLENGHVGVFRTSGNDLAHVVLRGGSDHSNYDPEHVAFLKVALTRAGLPPAVVIDCSHANSRKDPARQAVALLSVESQLSEGDETICGIMLESNLLPGQQKHIPGRTPAPGISITDGCIGWEETEELLRGLYDVLKVRY